MDDRYGGRRPSNRANGYSQAGNPRDYSYDNPYPAQHSSHHSQGYASHPPLPPGPPPSMYQFGQPSQNGYDNRRPPQQFNFNSNNNLPSYPDRAPPSSRYRHTRDSYERRDQDRRDRDRDRPSYHKRIRMASDRPLLHTRRESTPDQFDGMQDGDHDNPKFRNLDNMSDSDSEVMEESDSENEGSKEQAKVVSEELALPKWSNPEPYTSLPPPEASKKRRDVVKLIRKARITAAKEANGLKQLAQSDDFISFGFEEEDQEAPANAPPGPKAYRNDHSMNGSQVYQQVSTNGIDVAVENGDVPLPANNIAEKLASHKRKRSFENIGDQSGVQVPPKRLKTARVMQPTGEILREWASTHLDKSTPWAGQDQWTENAGFRLHKEVCDFYEYVKPCHFEETMRLDLLNRIRISVKKIYSDCEVHAFGSFAAGLYLPDADIDLVVISRDFALEGVSTIKSSNALHRFADHLIREGLVSQGTIEVITKAKVPLVKFKEDLTGIRIDVSFENLTGPRANRTFKEWKTTYPAMPILVTIIKQFLMMRGLNEVMTGGIGGFSVTCLVTALLQNMPRVQSGELIPENHLGEVLLEFLDLYGNQFDLYGTAIDLNPPRFVDKADVSNSVLERRENKLHIVDPNDRANDISGGSRNVVLIFKMFSYARTEILRAMRDRNSTSLLEWMLGGNYSMYSEQRTYLRRLYDAGKWTSVNISNEEQLLNDLNVQARNIDHLTAITARPLTNKNTKASEKEEANVPDQGQKTSTAILAETLERISYTVAKTFNKDQRRHLEALQLHIQQQINAKEQITSVVPTRPRSVTKQGGKEEAAQNIPTCPRSDGKQDGKEAAARSIPTGPRSETRQDGNEEAIRNEAQLARLIAIQAPMPVVEQTMKREAKRGVSHGVMGKAAQGAKRVTTPALKQTTKPLAGQRAKQASILALRFTDARIVQGQFPLKHREHIIDVVKIPELSKDSRPVYRLIFDSVNAATQALASRKGDAKQFQWDTPANRKGDQRKKPRKRKAATEAPEITDIADGVHVNKRPRIGLAPSPPDHGERIGKCQPPVSISSRPRTMELRSGSQDRDPIRCLTSNKELASDQSKSGTPGYIKIEDVRVPPNSTSELQKARLADSVLRQTPSWSELALSDNGTTIDKAIVLD